MWLGLCIYVCYCTYRYCEDHNVCFTGKVRTFLEHKDQSTVGFEGLDLVLGLRVV